MPFPPEIDRATLAGPVSRAVGSDALEVADWRQESVHAAFNESTGGLYRVAGTAWDGAEVVSWSLILKVVQASDGPFGGSDDPAHANYWKREALIYLSGVLETLPGIRAPRCFGVNLRGERVAWIWLEDIADPAGSRWPLDRYGFAARRLGAFNGAYLAGLTLPTEGSLSRGWARALAGTFAPAFAELPSIREHPMVQRCWPGGLLDRVVRLWKERDRLLRALDRLPQTFCHLDAFPRNLLVDHGAEQVVAVDWSFAGIGAIGAELAPMAAASVAFYDAEPADMPGIDGVVFDGYLEGLRAAGWTGDPRLVRLGQTAASALHYGLFPMGVLLADRAPRSRFEEVFARPAADIADRWADAVPFLLDQADEARHLSLAI